MKKRPLLMAIKPRELYKVIKKLFFVTQSLYQLPFFASFCYLTGARISEALAVRKRDISFEEDCIVVNLRTLKHKDFNVVRQIPIAPIKIDKPFYKLVYDYLVDNIDTLKEDEPIWFQFVFKTRWLINKYFKKVRFKVLMLDEEKKQWVEGEWHLFPHYLRHCRASHLVAHFNFREYELMKFMGWVDSDSAKFYIKLDYRDLLKKMYQADMVLELFNRYLREEYVKS